MSWRLWSRRALNLGCALTVTAAFLAQAGQLSPETGRAETWRDAAERWSSSLPEQAAPLALAGGLGLAQGYLFAQAYGLCAAAAFPFGGVWTAVPAGLACALGAERLSAGGADRILALANIPTAGHGPPGEGIGPGSLNPDAARLAGWASGLALAVPGGDYKTYERGVRAASEDSYRASKAAIDPLGRRGHRRHLHHAMPVKCGFKLLIPARWVAAPFNLRMLSAAANRRLGAMGC